MDFESSTIAYSFVGFDGGAVTKLLILIHRNKHKCYCVQMVKRQVNHGHAKIVMASAVDFSTKKLIKIKVCSSCG
jgi:hypothetical protein